MTIDFAKYSDSKSLFVLLAIVCIGGTFVVGSYVDSRRQDDLKAESKSWSEQPTHPITREDRLFGEQQLNRLLTDRPEMRAYVSCGDDLWNWSANQFGGESTGFRIYWHNVPPAAGFKASHYSFPPLIMLRASESPNSMIGEELWASLVFELHNIRNEMEFTKADQDAISGRLSKREWIQRTAALEYKSGHECAMFYYSVWVPHCKKAGLILNPHCKWHTDDPTLSDFLGGASPSYFRNLELDYDNVIAPQIH